MSAEPLKLADALGRVTTCPDVHSAHCPVILDAAAELHRLHAEVTRLGIREAADVEEIGRLHAENERLKTVMIAAAEEISEHWEAHCDAEGYGPANLMHRLENGIASEYGYTAGAFAKLKADNSRLQATLDAAVAAARAEERAARDAEIAALQTRLDSCQRGYTMRLSDAEMKPAMDAMMQRIKDDPSYRVSLLHKAGVVNEDGTLSEDYKP